MRWIILLILKESLNYVEGKLDISSDPFTEHESNLYTIFSLSQYLKAKAYEQGLNVELNATVKREDIVNVMDAVLKGDISKVQELNNKMQEDIKNQLPS